MVNANVNALGIIFPNSYDACIPDLVNVRLMASVPFASRYRLIDFILSSMVNCGIDNITIMTNTNYQSLMDHLGSGREWDLVRKHGGLNIFPPYAEKSTRPFVGRVGALANILDFLSEQKEKYVVLSDTNLAVNFDFSSMIQAHIASGADVTVAYREQAIPESFKRAKGVSKGYYYTFRVEDGRITKIFVNPTDEGIQNFSMNIYVIERELLIKLVKEAFVLGQQYLGRDILVPQLARLNVQAYKYDGYTAYITSIRTYFEENMKLLDDYNLDALFSAAPIYTKIRDDNPTRYIEGARIKNSMVADGCVIEGDVENCILFRGVKVARGASIKNCILMQDTTIGAGSIMDYVITDKNVTISPGKELKGTDTFPAYISKNHTV